MQVAAGEEGILSHIATHTSACPSPRLTDPPQSRIRNEMCVPCTGVTFSLCSNAYRISNGEKEKREKWVYCGCKHPTHRGVFLAVDNDVTGLVHSRLILQNAQKSVQEGHVGETAQTPHAPLSSNLLCVSPVQHRASRLLSNVAAIAACHLYRVELGNNDDPWGKKMERVVRHKFDSSFAQPANR